LNRRRQPGDGILLGGSNANLGGQPMVVARAAAAGFVSS
jgi:hypothetical protein